jgi:predicted O-linked N-acetylglucosamine transferase (SPINDLY family)
MNDDQLAGVILDNQIDVLIECAGWTDGNRLRALVPRVAPVQATYLGYPNTTGIPTMDHRIVDWLTDPAGTESACSESLQRLDRCFVCFRPHDRSPAPALSAAMTDATAPICFASFNRVTKLSDECVATWARVLRETTNQGDAPPSRLLLKSAIVSDETRRDAAARFVAHGVDASRIDLVPYANDHIEHLAMYGQVDLALDTFPYHGTTTTCEAAWMGVPVLTRAGDAHRSRVGVSLLTTIGHPELIARDADDFVAKAVTLASDRARLRRYRVELRDQMRESPLCDARDHARALQDAARTMWRAWCARNAT